EIRAREPRFDALRLVHGDRDPLSRASQALGDPLVFGGDAVTIVDDEDHGVRLLERGIDLLLDERPQLAARAEPAGIDHEVRSAAEASVAVAPITREAGVIGNERVAGPRQSIEERRLAYVGPADQRDG